jgi:hypothetical protein
VTRFRPVPTNIRCKVRSSGAKPCCTDKIRRICAADRPGFSFFNADANSRTSAGVRGCDCRGEGTRASNPARCHSAIHRSNVHRLTRIDRPSGSVCVIAANARTSLPQLNAAGYGALGGLAAIAWLLPETSPLLYRGGFAVIAVLAAVLISAAGIPGSHLEKSSETRRCGGSAIARTRFTSGTGRSSC